MQVNYCSQEQLVYGTAKRAAPRGNLEIGLGEYRLAISAEGIERIHIRARGAGGGGGFGRGGGGPRGKHNASCVDAENKTQVMHEGKQQ